MKVLMLICALILTGCRSSAVETRSTNNPEIKIEKLFEHDGCTIYRFYDGSPVYFARCGGSRSLSWNQSYQCGKSLCYRAMLVVT